MTIITRKAAVGFLLLGIIIFLTAQFTFDHAVKFEKLRQDSSVTDVIGSTYIIEGVKPPVFGYRPHLVTLGENAPLFITGLVECFALLCYLVLKKLEPSINKAAEDLIIGLRKSDD